MRYYRMQHHTIPRLAAAFALALLILSISSCTGDNALQPLKATSSATKLHYRLVFFQYGSDQVTSLRAHEIIATAGAYISGIKYTSIELDGNTDSSEAAHYPQDLSVRRAQAVAAELVRGGVPDSVITTIGYGQTYPLVVTTAGTSAPENRRVEIIIYLR